MSTRSAIARAYTGGQEWGSVEEMTATIAELIDVTNRVLVGVHAKKGTQVWDALHVPRPYAMLQEPDPAEDTSVKDFFRIGPGEVVVDQGDDAT